MFDKSFWDDFYKNENTPWDMGYISSPLKSYIDQLTDKNKKILLPGAGNAHEAEYLWSNGFKNLDIVDISKLPLQNLKKRVPQFDARKLIQKDFFDLTGQYDLIIEQTFFCSLLPNQRDDYAIKMHSLLRPGAKLIGILFTFPLDPTQEAPPFGGSEEEYYECFSPLFNIKVLETASNSHPARQDREVFIILEKPNSTFF